MIHYWHDLKLTKICYEWEIIHVKEGGGNKLLTNHILVIDESF